MSYPASFYGLAEPLKITLDQATAYCPGCNMNVIRGKPGDTFDCATGGKVRLEKPNPEATNLAPTESRKGANV